MSRKNHIDSSITTALAGIVGGALLGSPLGLFGSVVGAVIGTTVSSLSEYYNKDLDDNDDNKSTDDH